METEFENGIKKLLLTPINFDNNEERAALFKQCVKFLFDAKTQIENKEEMMALFEPIRLEIVSETMPAMYSPENAKQEDLHFDFICDVEEIVVAFGPPPYLYSSTYEEFIQAHKLWLC